MMLPGLKHKAYQDELVLPTEKIVIGTKHNGWARKVQEWLNLHRYHSNFKLPYKVEIDDWFGPATSKAVAAFQQSAGIKVTGEVGKTTFRHLIEPMSTAFDVRNIEFGAWDFISMKNNFRKALLLIANQLVSVHPTEIHPNSGPWVRAFMKGHEGEWAAWCCGFVSTCIDFASAMTEMEMNSILPWSWSCEQTKQNAIAENSTSKYYSPEDILKNNIVPESGDLFLVIRKSDNRARHIGIVESVDKNNLVYCIEGNTNDEGSREGYELCKRIRNFANGNYGIIKLM